MQYLKVEESKDEDANRKKYENKEDTNFFVQSIKQNGIGKIIMYSLNVSDIEQANKTMSYQEKYHIFKNHAEPTKSFLLSTRSDKGCYFFSKGLAK